MQVQKEIARRAHALIGEKDNVKVSTLVSMLYQTIVNVRSVMIIIEGQPGILGEGNKLFGDVILECYKAQQRVMQQQLQKMIYNKLLLKR